MKQLQDWEEWMKDKLDDQEIVFQESHWEAAQKMIDAAESQPKPPFVWWGRGLFAVLLVGVLGIGGYLLWGSQAFVSNEKYVIESKQVEVFAEKQENTEKQDDKQQTQINTAKNELPNSLLENKAIANEKINTSKNAEKNIASLPSFVSSQTDRAARLWGHKLRGSENLDNNKSLDNFSKIAKVNTLATPENIAPKSIQTPVVSNATEILVEKQILSSQNYKEKNTQNILDNPQENNLLGTKEAEETINLNEHFDRETVIKSEIQTILPQVFTRSSELRSDITATELRTMKKHRFNRFHADIFVGASITENAKNIAPTAGLRLKYFIHKNIAVQLYGNYFTSNGFSIIKETQQIQYGLGFEEVTNRLTTTTLQYAEMGTGLLIPIKRHEVFAGIGYARLLKATGTLEKIERNSISAKGMLVESQSVGAYQEGLQKSDVAISFGYGYYLTRNLQIRLSGSWGLQDITDDSFLGNTQIDKNKQIRLGLAWSFK